MVKKERTKKMTEGQKRKLIEVLIKRKDTLEKNLAKIIKGEVVPTKDIKIVKTVLTESIIETKATIDEVKKTRIYRICKTCKKDIDLEYLTEHPLTKNCEKCAKKERKAKLKH